MKDLQKFLILAGCAGALAYICRRAQSGVGAAKNPYILISMLQDRGVDFGYDWNDLPELQQQKVINFAMEQGYRQSRRSMSSRSYGESYYRMLAPAYKKALQNTDAVGQVVDEFAEYTAYPVRDYGGNVVLMYHDQSHFPALDELKYQYHMPAANGTVRTAEEGFNACLALLADGGKFVWSDNKGSYGLRRELFASKGDVPMERRLRISILATKKNGGNTIQDLADKWTEGGGDWQACRTGIIDCLLTYNTAKEARAELRRRALEYIDQLKATRYQEDQSRYDEVPF